MGEEMEDKYDGDGISSSMDTMHHEGDMANMHMHHKSDMDMNMHQKSNVNVNIHKDGMHYSSSSDSEDMEGDSCKENGESCSDHSDCCSSACESVCVIFKILFVDEPNEEDICLSAVL